MTDGIDVTGGGTPSTGDPFLDQALREAAEDSALFGRTRDAPYVMKRANEFYEQTAQDGTRQQYLLRATADSMIENMIQVRLAAAAVKVPTSAERRETIADAEKRLHAEGWMREEDVAERIKTSVAQRSAQITRDTLDWFRYAGFAVINALILVFLPQPYKSIYGLISTLVMAVLTLRVTRKWKREIKQFEEQAKLSADKPSEP